MPQRTVQGPAPLDARDLATRFAGELVGQDHPAYDEARRVWNGSIDRRPALVARCAGGDDAAAAIRFARERDLPVAVRGGGHSVAGNGTCDGGLVVDLSSMKGVRVDPEARTARVQPGLLWRELDAVTQEFGLALTGGLISSTGVAGFTLGGGLGWLHRKYGIAADSLISAELVTAQGDHVRVSAEEEPELLWGLRGGGGNFGVVTEFAFALHPVGRTVTAGMVVRRGEELSEAVAAFRDAMAAAPDELTLGIVARLAPPAPFIPEDLRGRPVVVIAGMHCGSPERAERDLAEIRSFGHPIVDLFEVREYTQFQSMLDAQALPGFRNYWKAEFLSGLPSGAIDVLAEGLADVSSPVSDFKLQWLGGAIAKVAEDETAYGHREAQFVLNVNARWESPDDDEREVAWTRRLWERSAPYSHGGAYVNFMGEEGQERVRAAYGDAKYARLQALKDRYDPDNIFRLNQNVRPSARRGER
jgi:FAD/FMN-containing dehydrogenase